MGVRQVELSHEEVWDDSALISSWNEALAEYKKYHSIHVKGGSVRDLEAKISPRDPESESSEQANNSEAAEPISAGNEDPDATTSCFGQAQPSQKDATAAASVAPPPQALLGSVRDDNFKRLLMSWYYAGYYTGLFEGQQQVQRDQTPRS